MVGGLCPSVVLWHFGCTARDMHPLPASSLCPLEGVKGLVGIQRPSTRGGTLKGVIILGTFLDPSHLSSILAVHKVERMELGENPAGLGLSR